MRNHRPPGLALLLLKKFGSPHYRESLAGDLIEGYRRGGTRLWVWGEVLNAIGRAVLKRLPFTAWLSVIRGAILAVGLIMLGAATFSWAASLTDEGQSAVSSEP
jgi:hypothetical protein